ncbi:hypothetical protein FRB98_005036, partial [Tulasnella sp. 332]
MVIRSSGVIPLFVEGMTSIGGKKYASTSSGEDLMMWQLVLLYLRMWTVSESQRSVEKSASSQSNDDGAMSDAVCRLLAWYIPEHMIKMPGSLDLSDCDMLHATFAFIQQIFVVRPSAGLKFKLDEACEELIHMIKNGGVVDSSEISWSGARESYLWMRREPSWDTKWW